MHRQDNTISLISGTLSTLAQQAGLIGQEVDEQTEILEDLGNRVDHSEGRLKRADRKIKAFIRENEGMRAFFLCLGKGADHCEADFISLISMRLPWQNQSPVGVLEF